MPNIGQGWMGGDESNKVIQIKVNNDTLFGSERCKMYPHLTPEHMAYIQSSALNFWRT